MSSVNNYPSSIWIGLDSTSQTDQAMLIFERYHEHIYDFYFQSYVGTTSNETMIQENLTKFLTLLVAKSSCVVPFSCKRILYFENNVFIGINEANLLAQVINKSRPKQVQLNFTGVVSTDAFQYLVSDCGSDNNVYHFKCSGNNKRCKRQQNGTTKFEFFGDAIQCDHIKSLNQVLRTSSIKSLQLTHTCISDDGAVSLADALCHNTMLASLNLKDNKISFLGAQAMAKMLCKNTCLESLELTGNKIGNEGVAALGDALKINSSLQHLDLSFVQFGNEGLLGLAGGLIHNNGLKELGLNRNVFIHSDLEGMEALGKALKINSTLVGLGLIGTVGEDSGGRLIATLVNALDGKTSKLQLLIIANLQLQFTDNDMARMLQCHAPLLSLDLTENNLQPNHIQCIARAIQNGTFNIRGLWLKYNRVDDDSVISLFNVLIERRNRSSLVTLSLSGVKEISTVGIQQIINNFSLTGLQQLSLSEIRLGDDGVQQIATFINDSELVALHLDDVGMGDSGLIALSNVLRSNTKLTYLSAFNNANVTSVGMDSLLETVRDYNRTLCCLILSTSDSPIGFYLTLNKAKRDGLYGSDIVAASLFPLICEKYCDNISVLFSILQCCLPIYF